MKVILKLNDGERRRRAELDYYVAAALQASFSLPPGVAALAEVLHEEQCRMPQGASWCRCREIELVVVDSVISPGARQ